MTASMVTVMRIECSPSEAADLRELLESLDPVFHKLTKHEEQQLNRWTTMLAALNLPERQPTTPDDTFQEADMNAVANKKTVAIEPEPRKDFEIHRAVLVESDRIREAQIVQCMYTARDPDNCGVIWENRAGDNWIDTVAISTLTAVDIQTGRICRDPAVIRELIDIIMAEPEQRSFRR